MNLRRFAPRTVAGQLTAVVIGAVVFGVCVATALMFYFIYSGGVGPSQETLSQIRAARIAAVVNGVQAARGAGDAHYITKHANTGPVYVTWEPPPSSGIVRPPPKDSMVAAIEQDLEKSWRMHTLAHGRLGADAGAIYVKLDGGQTLRFTLAPYGGLRSLVLTQILFTLGVISFLIVFVSAWAVRWVTAPLTSIASAARAFGAPATASPAISPRMGRSKSRRPRARSTRCANACAASSTSARACWSPSATIFARR